MPRNSGLRGQVTSLLLLAAGACFAASSQCAESAGKIKVLLCTGDWKSQQWYQEVVMRTKDGKPSIYRGRYIIQEVEKAAPGRFEFTDVPNYIGQEYLSPDYLSQFDVVLLGDIMPHFPIAWQGAVNEFVKNGGGLLYCANHKWSTGVKHRGEPFEDCQPSTWPSPDANGHIEANTGDVSFQPVVSAADHAVIKGLDWASAPPLNYAYNMPARKDAAVLLTSPAVATRTWLISPTYAVPKPEAGQAAPELPPPDTKDLATWKRINSNRSGQMDLTKNVGQLDWVGVWSLIHVKSPDARKATIVATGDDSALVYLNGERVRNRDGKPSNNTNGEADLRVGWNTILLRCDQYTGWWGFSFNIQDEKGRTLTDLVYAPEPSDDFKPVVLEPKPILTAWDYGKGRAISSAAIFANDESSEKFGAEWKDFGKYYAQVFGWLGEHSQNKKTVLKDATAEVNVTVDFTKPLNKISPGLFSIHGNEGIEGVALTNYMSLNPKGAFYRFGVDYESQAPDGADVNTFNWGATKKEQERIDKGIAEARRYGVEPIAGFHGITYNCPQWLWKDNWWGKCSDKQAAEVAKMFAAVIEHVNKGKKGDNSYELNLKYVELGNEPDLDESCIDGYMKMVKAISERIRRDYPGVKLIVYCPYRPRFIHQFIDTVGADFDALSFHPYGWTLDVLFPFLQSVEDYYVQKVGRHVELMITEWDFWIEGRQKFDYMVRRNYRAVAVPDLVCALHYRLWQYGEPIYLFGVLHCDWGVGKGKAGTPMHDAYDAFWIWKDFRGERVESRKTLAGNDVSEKLLHHVHADASTGDGRFNAVLYYDWAYGGTGYKDFARGLAYPKVKVNLKLQLPEALMGKKLTLSEATGQGFSDLKKDVPIPDGQKEYTDSIEMAPLTAVSVTVK
ncbi:MAG: hypothetical protein NTW87_21495 [Planctomycetota bacterium]|nr:hypothetical protein [Planctomycetota bacterium]